MGNYVDCLWYHMRLNLPYTVHQGICKGTTFGTNGRNESHYRRKLANVKKHYPKTNDDIWCPAQKPYQKYFAHRFSHGYFHFNLEYESAMNYLLNEEYEYCFSVDKFEIYFSV